MRVLSLGLLPYRDAWQVQEQNHAAVVAGDAPPTVLFVEHPPVITFGRRAELSASHLVASAAMLEKMGVEVVESDRGGDVTFHGPGQLVAYPIVRLADFRLSVGAYVRRLQEAVIATVQRFGVEAGLDPSAIGVWTSKGKLAAIGVRVKAGTTLHGLALNVTTDLSYFNLIVPCGIANRPVTSLRELLGDGCPAMHDVAQVLAEELHRALNRTDPAPDLK
jgi:lipoate-protein ligase B